MKFLIIDSEYRVYQSDILTGHIRSQARAGNITVVDTKNNVGLVRDSDGHDDWQEVQCAVGHRFGVEDIA